MQDKVNERGTKNLAIYYINHYGQSMIFRNKLEEHHALARTSQNIGNAALCVLLKCGCRIISQTAVFL